MKKVYNKPDILFEDFALSTNIAASCDFGPEDSELYLPGEGFVFVESCQVPIIGNVGGDGEYNGICYHVPTTGVNVFES